MKATFAVSVLIGAVLAAPEPVSDVVAPVDAPMAGCVTKYDGGFQIAVVPTSKMNKRDITEIQKRSTCGEDKLLEMTLEGSVLKDASGRTGYIASNNQFQFDGPPQAGAKFTGGFSVCSDGSLALGSSNTWYQCLSGNFYNLYTEDWAEQCETIGLIVLPCDGSATPADELVVGADAAIPVCQIDDGQVQAHTTPCVTLTASATATQEVPTPSMTGSAPVLTSGTTVPSSTAVVTPSTPAESTTGAAEATGNPNVSGVSRAGASIVALVLGLAASCFYM